MNRIIEISKSEIEELITKHVSEAIRTDPRFMCEPVPAKFLAPSPLIKGGKFTGYRIDY